VRDRMGLEFAAPLTRDLPGAAEAGHEKASPARRMPRKAG
jgi:hypothetical protein